MKSISIAKVVLFCLCVFCPLSVSAYGPPDYLPDGAHPRIWLTSTMLSELDAIQESNGALWSELEKWCDTHLGDKGYDLGLAQQPKWDRSITSGSDYIGGYRMSGYRQYILSFALAAKLLEDDNPAKAQSYFDYVRAIIINGIAGSMSAGDEANNGLQAIRNGESSYDSTTNNSEAAALGLSSTYSYKLGYPARNVYPVALAYDWLYDYWSDSDRKIIRNMLFRWYDWMRGVRSEFNNGVLVGTTRYYEDTDGDCTGNNVCTSASGDAQKAYAYESEGNNFFGGELAFQIMAVMATYGDDAYAATLLSDLVSDPLKRAADAYTSDLRLSGGDSSEGASYYGGYEFSARGVLAYATATGNDLSDFGNWPLELLSNNIQRLYPDLTQIPIWGDTNSNSLGFNLGYILGPFYGINAQLNPSNAYTGVAKYLLENGYTQRAMNAEENLLWLYKQPTSKVQSPDAAGLATFYHAAGTGLITMRSGWSNQNTDVFGAIRIEAKREAAHENYDDGGFYIARGDDPLIGRITYDDRSKMTSTIVFADQEYNSPDPDSIKDTAIDRAINAADYAYASGHITTPTSGSLYQYTNKAELFKRSMLYVRPNIFIIYDVTKSHESRPDTKAWYVQFYGEPTITGTTSSYTSGDSSVYVNALYPSGILSKEEQVSSYTPKSWWNTHLSVEGNQYDQFLHVIQVTESGVKQTTQSLIAGEKTRGALIGSIVAMFSSDEEGADITGGASYTADATIHYLCDLPPYAKVIVSRNGVELGVFSSGKVGVISFSSDPGTALYTIEVSGGGNVIPPVLRIN